MFVRNGQALGSVLHSAAPKAGRPHKTKRETKTSKPAATEHVSAAEVVKTDEESVDQ